MVYTLLFFQKVEEIKYSYFPNFINETKRNYNTQNGHTYYLYEIQKTWEDACKFCESRGGYLATITSSEEQVFLETMGNNRYWIGGTDKNSEGFWEWVSGEEFGYTNWLSGEPNNMYDAGEDYLAIWPKTWNDLANNSIEQNGFICEVSSYKQVSKYNDVMLIANWTRVG